MSIGYVNYYHHRYDRPVVVFDIDGVMNDYPDCWIRFVNDHLGTKFEDLRDLKLTVSYSQYKSLKKLYRDSGYKLESITANPEVSEVVKTLHQEYSIVIVTARPVDRHVSLYTQTIKWLEKYDIPFDDIIFSDRKQLEVLGRYPQTSFIVEDNGSNANLLARFGYKVYLVNNRYNSETQTLGKVSRVDKLTEIEEYLDLKSREITKS